MYTVYALIDPRDRKPFYVGITDDMYRRFVQHINCDGSNYEKNKRIMELRSLNLMVIAETLEQTEDLGYARIREAYWIHHYEILGYPLTNVIRPEHELKTRVLVRSIHATKKLVEKQLVVKKPVSVTPEIRNEIIRLRKRGFNRTEIRDAMGFNGEQFKMIKQTLDEEGL